MNLSGCSKRGVGIFLGTLHGGRIRDSTCFGYQGRAPRRCVTGVYGGIVNSVYKQRNSVAVKSVKEGGTYWRGIKTIN